MRRGAAVAGGALLLVAALGCSGGDDADGEAPATPDAPATTAEPTAPPTADAAPRPRRDACYELTYDDVLAPTNDDRAVSCGSDPTAQSYRVGTLDALAGDHLLAVDSARVARQAADRCRAGFAEHLGGGADDVRLSVLRPVWFTPTVEQSDEGADWYRCDVVAVAASERLAPLPARTAGLLSDGVDDRWAMCGTAEPGTSSFARVACSEEHSWRALEVVDLGDSYPGQQAAQEAGQTPCEAAGRAVADDVLDFEWGYEWPTREQWDAGQAYGLCWAPD